MGYLEAKCQSNVLGHRFGIASVHSLARRNVIFALSCRDAGFSITPRSWIPDVAALVASPTTRCRSWAKLPMSTPCRGTSHRKTRPLRSRSGEERPVRQSAGPVDMVVHRRWRARLAGVFIFVRST
jgi:hypothetical protein